MGIPELDFLNAPRAKHAKDAKDDPGFSRVSVFSSADRQVLTPSHNACGPQQRPAIRLHREFRVWPEAAKRRVHELRRDLDLCWVDAVQAVEATWPDPISLDLLDRHRRALAELGPERAARDLVAELVFRRNAAAESWQLVGRSSTSGDGRRRTSAGTPTASDTDQTTTEAEDESSH